MQRWKNIFWLSASVVAVGILITAVAPRAIAQIRAALVRDMDSAIRGTRFVEDLTSFLFAPGAFSNSQVITPIIPAGKKLFLQKVSTHVLLTDSQSVMEFRLTINSTPPTVIWVGQVFQAVSTGGTAQRHFTGNEDINLLMNPGESITVFVFRNDNLGVSSTNFAKATIIGYLVDTNP